MKTRIFLFVPLLIIITGFCGLVAVVMQQNYRLNANDPQIQTSEDLALLLSNGAKPQDVLPKNSVDIAYSLSPFVIIYDTNGKVMASNASLNGEAITIPSGVIAYTKTHTQDRVTWQPTNGVRSALVVTQYTGGFVAVGKSLREVETREASAMEMVAFVWGLAVVSTGAFLFVIPLGKGK